MESITDYIVIAAFLYFFFSGWSKGFAKTLLGPLSLIIGCAAGFFYYQKTQNLGLSLGISVFGPFLINVLASILLRIWNKSVSCAAPLSSTSKICASTLSVLWGGSYLALMLFLIGITPIRFGWFAKMQDDILASRSYALIDQHFGKKMPGNMLDIKKIAGVLQNPEQLEKLQSTEEFEALRSDNRLQELISDKELAEHIKNKDYGKLLANPKMQEIFQDKELLEKIFAVNKVLAEEAPEKNSGPKVIEIQK